MKKILIFNDGSIIGGSEILLIDILNHLQHRDCSITLLLPFPSLDTTLLDSIPKSIKIDYLYGAEPNKLKRVFYTNLMVFLPRVYAKLVGLKANKYDLVVCFKNSFYSIVFSKIKRRKYVWIHTQPYKRTYESTSLMVKLANVLNKMHLDLTYNCFKRYDQVFCVSNICREELYKEYPKGKELMNATVMYNAMNLGEIEVKANESIDLEKMDIPTFIVVHRFSPEKRQDRMIEVSKRLLSDGYKFRIVMLGKGSEYEHIQQMVQSNELEDTILMLGYQKNPYPYIKQSDWLVVCSSIESFSLVLLEAMQLDTPIITTECGGPVDVIDGGKYGLLTENSTEGVYKGMKKVLENPQLWDYYTSMKAEALSRFDYDQWLAKIDAIFLENDLCN